MKDLPQRLSGKFIVLDGPDGAGKSTQLSMLAEFLRGQSVDVIVARDPGGTAVGDRIRAILLDRVHEEMSVRCELMLYMASRAQLADQVLRPALAAGRCVLCDRYVSATIAYQGAGGIDAAMIRQVAEVAVGGSTASSPQSGLWPDLTIILDIPSEEGLSRSGKGGGKDRMESKALEFHRKVRESFLHQASESPEKFAVVDASGDVEQVQRRLRRVLMAFCRRGAENAEIKKE